MSRKPMHFIVVEPGSICLVPRCGQWGESGNWTNDPRAVTCEACLIAMALEEDARRDHRAA
jgi:hypothetical protein